jgi:beta-mannosidase
MKLSLDGTWQLFFFPEQDSPIKHPDDLQKSGAKSIPAQVPGNVELDLQRAGLLPEPFYADNIRKLRS